MLDAVGEFAGVRGDRLGVEHAVAFPPAAAVVAGRHDDSALVRPDPLHQSLLAQRSGQLVAPGHGAFGGRPEAEVGRGVNDDDAAHPAILTARGGAGHSVSPPAEAERSTAGPRGRPGGQRRLPPKPWRAPGHRESGDDGVAAEACVKGVEVGEVGSSGGVELLRQSFVLALGAHVTRNGSGR